MALTVIRILDHAGARAHATTGESLVSVASDIAGNSRLHAALPPISATPDVQKNECVPRDIAHYT
jgi:hypothetical protein